MKVEDRLKRIEEKLGIAGVKETIERVIAEFKVRSMTPAYLFISEKNLKKWREELVHLSVGTCLRPEMLSGKPYGLMLVIIKNDEIISVGI